MSLKHKSWMALLCVTLQSILSTQDGVNQPQTQPAGTPTEMRLCPAARLLKQREDKP